MMVMRLVVLVIGTLLAGFPVAFTLAGTSLILAGVGAAFGVFDPAYLAAMPSRLFGVMMNDTLVAVPLFVFMGVMLERSRLAEELLETMSELRGSVRGGLAMAVTVVGMLLAASTGIVGATVVTMGLLSLPVMVRRGYDPAVASGAICASGTLGQIIPPSVVLVVLADQLGISVGDLFVGSLIPGLMLAGLYGVYVAGVAFFRPEAAPAMPAEERDIPLSELMKQVMLVMVPPLVLILLVLGSIFAGIATPTEASGVGARLSFDRAPLLPGIAELAAQEVVPGGTRRNLAYVSDIVSFAADVTSAQQLILADAQTSGGLLLAVPADRCAAVLDGLRQRGVAAAADIGEITAGTGISVVA